MAMSLKEQARKAADDLRAAIGNAGGDEAEALEVFKDAIEEVTEGWGMRLNELLDPEE